MILFSEGDRRRIANAFYKKLIEARRVAMRNKPTMIELTAEEERARDRVVKSQSKFIEKQYRMGLRFEDSFWSESAKKFILSRPLLKRISAREEARALRVIGTGAEIFKRAGRGSAVAKKVLDQAAHREPFARN